MKVKVGVSNRHIHLSKVVFDYLFDDADMLNTRDLSQGGEFVSNLTVDLIGPKGKINNVKVVGPLRTKTQVEVSKTDAYKLGINPPIRMSNNFDGAEDIMLSSNGKKCTVKNCCILANRHIHLNSNDLKGLADGQKVSVKVLGDRGGIMDNVIVKTKDTFSFELHIDTDEANAFGLKNGDEVEIQED